MTMNSKCLPSSVSEFHHNATLLTSPDTKHRQQGWGLSHVQPQKCFMSTLTSEFIPAVKARTCQGLLLNGLSAFLNSFAYMPLHRQHNANGIATAVTGSANILLKCSTVWLILHRVKRRNMIILRKRAIYYFSISLSASYRMFCRRLLFVESEAWNLSPLILIYKQKCWGFFGNSSVCARKNGSGRIRGRQTLNICL